MPITNRELAPGTILTGTLKKTVYQAEVVERPDGIRYRVNGKDYKSPSAAGSAVMNGVACNGWRFWNVQGGETPLTDAERLALEVAKTVKQAKTAKTPKAKAPASTKFKQVKRNPNQKGVAEGQVRWFCSACMKGFAAPEGETPDACPEGHPREVEDELAVTEK